MTETAYRVELNVVEARDPLASSKIAMSEDLDSPRRCTGQVWGFERCLLRIQCSDSLSGANESSWSREILSFQKLLCLIGIRVTNCLQEMGACHEFCLV